MPRKLEKNKEAELNILLNKNIKTSIDIDKKNKNLSVSDKPVQNIDKKKSNKPILKVKIDEPNQQTQEKSSQSLRAKKVSDKIEPKDINPDNIFNPSIKSGKKLKPTKIKNNSKAEFETKEVDKPIKEAEINPSKPKNIRIQRTKDKSIKNPTDNAAVEKSVIKATISDNIIENEDNPFDFRKHEIVKYAKRVENPETRNINRKLQHRNIRQIQEDTINENINDIQEEKVQKIKPEVELSKVEKANKKINKNVKKTNSKIKEDNPIKAPELPEDLVDESKAVENQPPRIVYDKKAELERFLNSIVVPVRTKESAIEIPKSNEETSLQTENPVLVKKTAKKTNKKEKSKKVDTSEIPITTSEIVENEPKKQQKNSKAPKISKPINVESQNNPEIELKIEKKPKISSEERQSELEKFKNSLVIPNSSKETAKKPIDEENIIGDNNSENNLPATKTKKSNKNKSKKVQPNKIVELTENTVSPTGVETEKNELLNENIIAESKDSSDKLETSTQNKDISKETEKIDRKTELEKFKNALVVPVSKKVVSDTNANSTSESIKQEQTKTKKKPNKKTVPDIENKAITEEKIVETVLTQKPENANSNKSKNKKTPLKKATTETDSKNNGDESKITSDKENDIIDNTQKRQSELEKFKNNLNVPKKTNQHNTKSDKPDTVVENVSDKKELPLKAELQKSKSAIKPDNKKKADQQKEQKTETKPEKIVKKVLKPLHKSSINFNHSKLVSEGKNQIAEDMLSRLKFILDNRMQIFSGSKIILAVSGGSDSVTMLDLFYQLAYRYNFDLIVCHFNHKIRGMSSDNDELFVKNLSAEYKLKFYSDKGDVKQYAQKNGFSVEHAARVLRYNFFERISKSLGINQIATAHNANDTAETTLINLFRGTGLTGLTGIPEKRELNKKITIIRPLLEFTKSEILEYANNRKLKWKEDETNSLLFYTRNKIRLDLIPKLINDFNPSIIETLNRTSKILKGADQFIKESLETYIKYFKWDKKKSRLYINIRLFKSLHNFLKGELIQTSLDSKFKLQPLSMNIIDRVIALMDSEVGAMVEINKDIIAYRDRASIVFTKSNNAEKFDIQIEKLGTYTYGEFKITLTEVTKKQVKYSKNTNIEYLDYDLIPLGLNLRTWDYGDTFQPLGMNGNMKISDFLINQKISYLDKKNVIVLSTKSEILWVCGLRISDKYKVDNTTRRYLKLEYFGPVLNYEIMELSESTEDKDE